MNEAETRAEHIDPALALARWCVVDGSRIRREFPITQFLDFVLSHYVQEGVHELDRDKLAPLLNLKYRNSIADAVADLGKPEEIGRVFAGFQKYLYQPGEAA